MPKPFAKPSVVVRLRGRLGNQLFQYAAGLALAQHHGVPLVLDESVLKHREKVPYALEPIVPEARRIDLLDPTDPVRAWVADLRLSKLDWKARRYRERLFGYDETLIDRRPPVILEGYFQSERYFRPVAAELRQGFERYAVRREADSRLPRDIAPDMAVAMHFRRGDYVTLDTFAKLPMSYYQRAVRILDALAPGPKHFLIFSDEPDWAETATDWLKPRTVIRTSGPLGMYDELVMFGRCAHAIIANSTFSWWGAYLRREPGGVTLAPRLWFDGAFRRSLATADLFPEGWISL